MQVVVKLICAPHPREEIEAALRAAGEVLALRADSVEVEVRATEPPMAILKFEMRRAAQYRVVDSIYATVKDYARAFCEDVTIRFPKV